MGLAMGAAAVSVLAQQASRDPRVGLPLDWSHRHMIYTNPDTFDEAARKGTLEEWTRNDQDPRFARQVLKKEHAQEKAQNEAAASRLKRGQPTTTAATSNSVHRDWSTVMGGIAGAGSQRVWPAKFNFGYTTKSCTDDFVVFLTNAAGVSDSGTQWTRVGTFTAAPAAGGTVTITNSLYSPSQVLVLTASATLDTKLNFLVGANGTDAAINLANAINRNGLAVGVMAEADTGVVTISSIASGLTTGNITAAFTLSNFSFAAAASGSGTAGQPTIFALNQLYAASSNGGCETSATQAVPNTLWAFNTSAATYSGSTISASYAPATTRYGPLSTSCITVATSTNPGTCDTLVTGGGTNLGFSVSTGTNAPKNTTATFTVYKNGVATAVTCNVTAGKKACTDNTHSLALVVGDVISVQIVRSGSGTGAWSPAFALTLGAPAATATAGSPLMSLDGTQVAFVEAASSVGSLVLLKWAAGAGTIGDPVTPGNVTKANYRSCVAPCMVVIPLSGSPNITLSSPYYDYVADVMYLGADDGTLHKFTGVFNGTPAEVTTGGWPATVSAGNILSAPVYDQIGGLVYVGSNGTAGANGNRLHSVNASGAVVSSGAIGSSSSGALANGVRAAPVVDPYAQRVYVFMGADNGATDSNGTACGSVCNAVYAFSTTTSLATYNAGLGAGLGAKILVGASGNNSDLNRSITIGAFDDKYYSSANWDNPTGNLYVCGSASGSQRRPTLWKVSIVNNAFGVATEGPLLVNNNATCSPVSLVKNGASEYLYLSVSNNGNAAGGTGCTSPGNGCIYMYQVTSAATFNATSAPSTISDGITRYFSASSAAALNTTESTVQTTLTAAQAGTLSGMRITQSNASPVGNTYLYTLRKNGANTVITCSIPTGVQACGDTTNMVTFAQGDTIDVSVVRSAGTAPFSGQTFQVQLGFNEFATASAALSAPGGTGGIIVDNTVNGGGSQVYYSTRSTVGVPGVSVQATQSGLN